ncbi:chitinase-1 [Colletotrichum higginsianum]|nr:chitinase-1 [Colletotrichum higginsianum]
MRSNLIFALVTAIAAIGHAAPAPQASGTPPPAPASPRRPRAMGHPERHPSPAPLRNLQAHRPAP